jgi:probable LLM family oxidoreductase
MSVSQRITTAFTVNAERDSVMQIGIDNFVAAAADPATGREVGAVQRMSDLLDEIELGDAVGLDSFGIGEHHRRDFYDSAPAVILAAAAARTKQIRLNSAVTVLSAADPVRVFQEFATLDLISGGRAEIVAGRGSFIEAFPLFGLALEDYDSLFEEKLELLLAIRDSPEIHWSGRHRAALTGQGVYPRPVQDPLPIWVGVGGTPQSFVRAGALGLPLMVAIIGGNPRQFRPLVDLYRETGRRAGHAPDKLKVGVHVPGLVGDSDDEAADLWFPGWKALLDTIGRERGRGPVTRQAFDLARGPEGAMFVGASETVTAKIIALSDALGGISRVSIQMTNAGIPHDTLMRGIELLGRRVAPEVRRATSSVNRREP